MNKKDIISTFIKLALIFILIDTLLGIFPSMMSNIITTSKYTYSIIAELTAVLIALIVIILTNNSNIFTTKKESIIKSIHIGLPMFLLSIIYLIINIIRIINTGSINVNNLYALIIYCLGIGLFEEFLCRGWILNEFLKISSNTRKEVITSIIISAFLFGLMHISNIWVAGQNSYITFLQICNAISLGCFLGAVYYRTKNIWAVSFLHGFYDFSLLLGEINLLKECTTNTLTTRVIIYETVSILMIIIMFIFCTMILLRRSVLNPLLEDPKPLSNKDLKEEKRIKRELIIATIIVCLLPIPTPPEEEYEKSQTCYNYETIHLEEYDITTTNKTKYSIEYIIPKYIETEYSKEENWIDNEEPEKTVKPDKYNFEIYKEENKINFINKNTNYKIQLQYPKIYNLYVYTNNDNTIILIETYEDFNSVIYYSNYIHKNNLSNEQKYLEELSESFIKIIAPDTKELGILSTKEEIYPLIRTTHNDIMIIKDEELLLVE